MVLYAWHFQVINELYCILTTICTIKYGTAQMQLHTRVRVLVCQHACVNMLSITCDGVLASLAYCKSRHTVMCQQPRKTCGTQVCYLQELLSHHFQHLISL